MKQFQRFTLFWKACTFSLNITFFLSIKSCLKGSQFRTCNFYCSWFIVLFELVNKRKVHTNFLFLIFVSCSSMNVAAEEDLEKYWRFVWRWIDVWIVLSNLTLKILINNHTRCIKHDLMSIKTLCSAQYVIEKKFEIEADVIWFERGKFFRRGM